MGTLRVGLKMKTRVICVCPSTQQILLSGTRSVENLMYSPPAVTLGSMDTGTIGSVDNLMGILVNPNIYVPLMRLTDRFLTTPDGVYSVGQSVKYRVIGYDLIDDLILVRIDWIHYS